MFRQYYQLANEWLTGLSEAKLEAAGEYIIIQIFCVALQ